MANPVPPKCPRGPRAALGCSLSVAESERLHTIAAERKITITKLVIDALRQTYGEYAPSDGTTK